MSDNTQEIRDALSKIIQKEGPACLKDISRFRGLWMDFAPECKESKLILSAVQEGVGSILLKSVDADTAEQRLCLDRCVRKLTDLYIVEDGAKFAVREIC